MGNINISKLKPGDILSEQQFYTVLRVDIMRRSVILTNDYGKEPLTVSNSIVERDMYSADQFEEEHSLSRTELINLVMGNPNIVMTIHFNKKPDQDQITEELYSIYANKKGKIISEKEYRAKIKAIIATHLHGELRKMRGRHFGKVDGFGRLTFIDMEAVRDIGKTYDNRIRLVDPRTINLVIVKNVKYIVI